MNLFEHIEHFISDHQLIKSGSSIILGFSGGPDSLFLLHFLVHFQRQHDIKIIAAHLDHQWRPDSNNDVFFCKQAAEQLNIPFISARMSDLPTAITTKGSKEEIGRKARRYFLEQVRKEHNADLIALAHHAQDQQETFFIRLIRGTSLTGLCGMRPKYGVFIRPLLETNKNDIVAYLKEHTIPFLIDPSNESPEFLRNRIRATVLPALQECDKRFDDNFLMTIHRLQETEDYLQLLTHIVFEKIMLKDEETSTLDLSLLLEQPKAMQNRLLVYWLVAAKVPFTPTESFLEEIMRFIRQPGSKTHSIGTWKLIKSKNKLSIAT